MMRYDSSWPIPEHFGPYSLSLLLGKFYIAMTILFSCSWWLKIANIARGTFGHVPGILFGWLILHVGSGQHIFVQFDHYIVLIASGTHRLVTTGKHAPQSCGWLRQPDGPAVLVLLFRGSWLLCGARTLLSTIWWYRGSTGCSGSIMRACGIHARVKGTMSPFSIGSITWASIKI
jgi:hypothetical protein